jgi:hypothetical protein
LHSQGPLAAGAAVGAWANITATRKIGAGQPAQMFADHERAVIERMIGSYLAAATATTDFAHPP